MTAMAPRKGFTHSAEARAAMSAARKGLAKSDEHKRKISEANKGKVRARTVERVCECCGEPFMASSDRALRCSMRCKRVAKLRSLVHSAPWAHFERVCAICGSQALLVGDHCHASGEPRGILCRACNVGLGYFADSPARLRAAALYLEAAP